MMVSEDLERMVLGACLVEDEVALDEVTSRLVPEHFSLASFRTIFRSVDRLHRKQAPVNWVTVEHDLEGLLELESVGRATVQGLTEGMPRKMRYEVPPYIERLLEAWRKRQLQVLGDELVRGGASVCDTSASLTELATRRLEMIVSESSTEKCSVAEFTVEALERFEQERSMTQAPGLSFGIPELDAVTGGMMPGHQIALRALSGVGKTTMMIQAIAANCSNGIGVDAFLLEPSKSDVLRKLWAWISGVNYAKVLKPWTASRDEAGRVRLAAGEVAEWPLRLHDKSSMTLDEIVGLARLSIHRHNTKLICVDYLQRVQIKSEGSKEDVRLRIARASTALADLVKGTDCRTLVLSQLTRRGVAQTPTMQDFRESGQIENDAHTIVLLHLEFDEDNGHFRDEGAILVPKQRFGHPCNLRARFDRTMARWECVSAR